MDNYEATITIINGENKETHKAEIHEEKDKNTLFYKEKDGTNTTYDYKNHILKRDNDELYLEFKFNLNEKTTNSINIKEINHTINTEITTKELYKDQNRVEVVYEMNDTVFKYIIDRENY